MSTQRGNETKKRAQKHKNITSFKNDKYDTTGQMKAINKLVVSNVCKRCKDCIEWKIKYKKYKSLTVPAKCKKCDLKKVKYAYHMVCSDCSVSLKICGKCGEEKKVVGEVEKSTAEKQKEESHLREELKFMKLREKRTLLRQLEKGQDIQLNSPNKSKCNEKVTDEGGDEESDHESDHESNHESVELKGPDTD